MSLSETEIMDRLRSSLRQAIDDCKKLAVKSNDGSPYESLRTNLHLIEGCCRQMAAYRDDTRWLPFGVLMGNIHQRAGDWLRGYVKREGLNLVYVIWRPGILNEAFLKVAAELIVILDGLEKLSTMATGRTGPILPAVGTAERRFGRPALDNRSKKPQSLIIPAKYRQIG